MDENVSGDLAEEHSVEKEKKVKKKKIFFFTFES